MSIFLLNISENVVLLRENLGCKGMTQSRGVTIKYTICSTQCSIPRIGQSMYFKKTRSLHENIRSTSYFFSSILFQSLEMSDALHAQVCKL